MKEVAYHANLSQRTSIAHAPDVLFRHLLLAARARVIAGSPAFHSHAGITVFSVDRWRRER